VKVGYDYSTHLAVVFVSDEKLKDELKALIAELGIDMSITAQVIAARDIRSVLTHPFMFFCLP